MKWSVQLMLLLLLFISYFTEAALYVEVRKSSVDNISLIVQMHMQDRAGK